MSRIKKSYGVICCRKDPVHGLQIILIKKPTTYHFCEFVAGHYRKSDDAHLKKLFNNMTYHEKMDILSMKFAVMWYRMYKVTPEQVFSHSNNFYTKQYMRKKAKFEVSFLHDSGIRLKKLMADTVNAETLWEVPKGRRQENIDEGLINAAIREFSEETLIDRRKYQMLWHLKPYIETYSDFGTTYQNIFYYADITNNDLSWEPNIVFSNGQQISEVSAVRWCSFVDIKAMRLDPNTHRRLVNMFKKMAKKYKNKYSKDYT
jgi:8-oxo-dGTP pyrophosphatase MutT (NUDIX family)